MAFSTARYVVCLFLVGMLISNEIMTSSGAAAIISVPAVNPAVTIPPTVTVLPKSIEETTAKTTMSIQKMTTPSPISTSTTTIVQNPTNLNNGGNVALQASTTSASIQQVKESPKPMSQNLFQPEVIAPAKTDNETNVRNQNVGLMMGDQPVAPSGSQLQNDDAKVSKMGQMTNGQMRQIRVRNSFPLLFENQRQNETYFRNLLSFRKHMAHSHQRIGQNASQSQTDFPLSSRTEVEPKEQNEKLLEAEIENGHISGQIFQSLLTIQKQLQGLATKRDDQTNQNVLEFEQRLESKTDYLLELIERNDMKDSVNIEMERMRHEKEELEWQNHRLIERMAKLKFILKEMSGSVKKYQQLSEVIGFVLTEMDHLMKEESKIVLKAFEDKGKQISPGFLIKQLERELNKVVKSVRDEANKVQHTNQKGSTNLSTPISKIKPRLILETEVSDCDRELEMAKKSLVTCGMHNKDALMSLMWLQTELNSLAQACNILFHIQPSINKTEDVPFQAAEHGNNCNEALNITMADLSKCMIEEPKIGQQIEQLNRTLIDARCKCGPNCFNGSLQNAVARTQNQFPEETTVANLFNLTNVMPNVNHSEAGRRSNDGVFSSVVPHFRRTHITDEKRPKFEQMNIKPILKDGMFHKAEKVIDQIQHKDHDFTKGKKTVSKNVRESLRKNAWNALEKTLMENHTKKGLLELENERETEKPFREIEPFRKSGLNSILFQSSTPNPTPRSSDNQFLAKSLEMESPHLSNFIIQGDRPKNEEEFVFSPEHISSTLDETGSLDQILDEMRRGDEEEDLDDEDHLKEFNL